MKLISKKVKEEAVKRLFLLENQVKNENQSKFINIIKILATFIQKIKNNTKKLNKKMEGKYSPTLISIGVTGIACVLASIMLFFPNYLGVADDGSITEIMNAVDVHYIQDEVGDVYNNYFVRTYARVQENAEQNGSVTSSHIFIVKAAVLLDDIVTKDRYFDIRFLGLLYLLLFIPGFYFLIKQACSRVKRFSEGVVIGVVGLLIFSDVAYITYFNSFYPEALWFISLIYCVGFALSFQEKRKGLIDFLYLILFLVAGTVLVSSKWQCSIIGIIIAVYCIRLFFIGKHWLWGVACIIGAFYISFIAIVCMIGLNNDFNETSKFHAMTRGVLFGSTNPEKTLTEFGIDSSYEVLTDASSYDYFPMVQADDLSLKNGFLDQYTTLDIAAYYARHPGKVLGMIDVSVKSSFSIRRSYCGNYEKSVGLPEKAKSIFWSIWSTFKDTSAPKTVGYLFILLGGVLILFGKGYSLRPIVERRSTIFLDMMLVIMLISISQSIVTIIFSGDAEMIQHCFLVNFGTDIVTYFVFSEVLHKLNII